MDFKNSILNNPNSEKTISTGTGYRIVNPSKTWDKLKDVCSDMKIDIQTQKIFGVDISNTTLRCLADGKFFEIKQEGKGLSSDQSNVSGVMEIIERYCYKVPENSAIFYDDYEHISNQVLYIKPVFCYTCSKKYDDCEEKNLKKCKEWVKVYSLITGKEMFVPKEAVYSFLISKFSDCIVGKYATGLSAGNTIDEAILHGLFEVIERAEAYPFHYSSGMISAINDLQLIKLAMEVGINKVALLFGERNEWPELNKYPIIDLSDFDMYTNYNKNFLDNISLYQISKDFHGLNVYTMAAEIKGKVFYYRGFGTHLDPSIAINRAITELVQIGRQNIENLGRMQFKNVSTKGILSSELINYSTGSIKSDIEKCVNSLSKAGLDIVVANLTKKSIGIPVVRVMIPDIKYL